MTVFIFLNVLPILVSDIGDTISISLNRFLNLASVICINQSLQKNKTIFSCWSTMK